MSFRKYSDGSSSSSSYSNVREAVDPKFIPPTVLKGLLDFRQISSQLHPRQTWHLSPQWTWDSRGGPKGQIHTSTKDFREAGGIEYDELAYLGKKKVLGKGSYGEVVLVACSGRYLARKRSSINPKDQEEMLGNIEEINILKQLSHQHIAQICGVYILGQELYSLSYPVAEKDLDLYLREGKLYDPTWVQTIIGGLGCLSRALAYAHSAGIKHKDIHDGNILVIGGTMILCDWGLSSKSNGTASRFGSQYNPRAEDIRRLGMVFQRMILASQTDKKKLDSARLPTSRLSSKDILKRMTSGPKRIEYPDFGDLIKVMTEPDVNKRPTAKQVADYLRLGDFAWAWRGGMPEGEGEVLCNTCGRCCI